MFDEVVEYVQKSWGHEKWLVNNKLYCGKILHVLEGHCCSYHYHKLKDETFYILNGHISLELDGNIKDMVKGDVVRLVPGSKHRFFAIEDSDIVEISTQHFDVDSYRLIASDKYEEKVV